MDLGQTPSSPIRESINWLYDSPHKKCNTGLLQMDLKNESLDIKDCVLDDPEFKEEPDYIAECESVDAELIADEDNSTIINNIGENTDADTSIVTIQSSNLNTINSQVSVIREIIINGQKRTCFIVNNPQLTQNVMEYLQNSEQLASVPSSPNITSPNIQSSMVNCTRKNPVPENENAQISEVTSSKKMNTDLHGSMNLSSSVSLNSSSPHGTNSMTSGFQNSVRVRVLKRVHGNSADTALHQLRELSGDISHLNTVYCNTCNFCSTSLTLMNNHMREHDRNTETDERMTIGVEEGTIRKIGTPQVIQNSGISSRSRFTATSNNNNTDIFGDIVGSKSRSVLKKNLERIPTKSCENIQDNGPKTLRFKSLLGPRNNSKRTTVDGQINGQGGTTPITESLAFNSVSEKNLAENTGGASSLPRIMRTRSKSLSVNKTTSLTNLAVASSPKRTRSNYVCREPFISRDKARSCQNSSEGKDIDKEIGNTKQVNSSGEISSNGKAIEGLALRRGRSKSVMTENCNRQSLLKSIGLEDVSESRTLECSVTNRGNLGPNISQIDLNNGNSICESENSNSQSDSEIIVAADNDAMPSFQDYSHTHLLLLQDNTFSCSVCSFTTDKKRSLIDHERNHRRTKQKIFRCVYCSQRYTRYMLYLHIQNVHAGQKFLVHEELKAASEDTIHKCSECCYSTTDQEKLVLHMQDHSSGTVVSKDTGSDSVKDDPIAPLICFVCSFETSEQRLLRTHLANHAFKPIKRTDSLGTPIFDCGFCSYSSKVFNKALNHMSSHKNNRPIRTCPKCDYKSTANALFYHRKKCGIKSNSTKKLNINSSTTKARNDQKSAGASVTRKTTTQSLFNPLKRVNPSGHKFFSCKMCSYNSSHNRDILKHITSHKKKLPIMNCSNCNFKSTGHALKYHMLKCINSTSDKLPRKNTLFQFVKRVDPSGRLYFDCKTCSYRCLRNRDILKHIKGHEKKLPIMNCSNCNFKSTRWALNYHMRKCKNSTADKLPKKSKRTLFQPVKRILPSGRSYLGCKMCSYHTRYNRDILKHIKGHKKNSPIIKCPNCNFKSTGLALKYHMRKCKHFTSVDEQNSVDDSDAGPATSEMPTAKLAESNLQMLFQPVKRITDLGTPFFDCKICSYGCQRLGQTIAHIKSHKKNLPIMKCPNCNFKSTGLALKYHMRKCKHFTSADEQKSVDDSDAGHATTEIPTAKLAESNLQMLFQPVKRITDLGTTVFDCKICSYGCPRLSKTIAHIKSHKTNLPIMKCPNCNFKSTGLALKYHMRNCKHFTSADKQKSVDDSDAGQATTEMPTAKLAESNLQMLFQPVKRITDLGTTFFDCKICSYGCQRLGQTIAHIKSHKKNLPIMKCPTCNFKSTGFALKYHMRKCKISKSIEITDANDKSEPKKDKIDQSSIVVVQTEPKSLFKCTECPFFTSLRIKLKLHIRKHHLKTQQPVIKNALPQSFHCSRCSFFTNLRLKLKLHQKTCVVAKEQKLKFNYCSFVAKDTSSHQRHMRSHAKRLPRGALKTHTPESSHGRKVHKCTLCPFSTTIRRNYFRHMKKHENNRKSEQQSNVSIDNTNSDDANNKGIVATISNDPNSQTFNSDSKKSIFQCTQCSYSTCLRIKLKYHTQERHQPITTGHFTKLDELYQCNYCSYVCAHTGNCKRHINTHLKYKLPLKKCQNCDYRSTFHALRIHSVNCQGSHIKETTVSTDLKIVCPLCSHSTRRAADMRLHVKQHRTRPIRQCTSCSYRSTPKALSLHSSKCVEHIKQSSKVSKTCSDSPKQKKIEQNCLSREDRSAKRFKCQYCSFTTFWSYLIDRHMDSHTLLKLPVRQCEKCEFKSTPGALMAHAKVCTGKPLGHGALSDRNTPETGKVNDNNEKVNEFKINKLSNRTDKVRSKVLKKYSSENTASVNDKGTSICVSGNTASLDSRSTTVFKCPECPFATRLRIKLNIHSDRVHGKNKTRMGA